MRIDEALRTFLESFRLPGEAPVIQLILEHFSEAYFVSYHRRYFKDLLLYKIDCFINVSATNKIDNLTCVIIHDNLTREIIHDNLTCVIIMKHIMYCSLFKKWFLIWRASSAVNARGKRGRGEGERFDRGYSSVFIVLFFRRRILRYSPTLTQHLP